MKSIKYVSILLLSVLFINITSAQTSADKKEADKLSLDSGTIDNQFEFVFQRSNSYQDFKVIKKNWFYQLKSHTIDTLKSLKKQLVDTKLTIDGFSSGFVLRRSVAHRDFELVWWWLRNLFLLRNSAAHNRGVEPGNVGVGPAARGA